MSSTRQRVLQPRSRSGVSQFKLSGTNRIDIRRVHSVFLSGLFGILGRVDCYIGISEHSGKFLVVKA